MIVSDMKEDIVKKRVKEDVDEILTRLVVVVDFHNRWLQVPDGHILLQCHTVDLCLVLLQLRTHTFTLYR